MIKYFRMEEEKYTGKNGKTYKVIDFRERTNFPLDRRIKGKMTEDNLLRVDLIAKGVYGSELDYSGIIDANNKDVFSFSTSETIYFGI